MHAKETDVCAINFLKGKHGFGSVREAVRDFTTKPVIQKRK
jgi:hypothetical protein